ncbi:T9SS type A sorting domain-containing protein [Cytophagaceae bacterium YF14B1]|uniref:T9SS type A sorting domain-containing protein n=1 Tax=Xanthocytophaga flava TaxID=3048013 RepID=A0AAE3R032_9BACT|nr:T9SS type A sorting domain-containing protein [Xanthocytophaga flavus]MDJ1485663.1 T9SS type A sorting domain-containing protein [Xanthocytophaga flavus]
MQQLFTRFSLGYTQKVILFLFCITVGIKVRAQNLVTNGNFSSGNTGFTSEYTYVAPSNNTVLYPEGLYTLTSNPVSIHNLFCSAASIASVSGSNVPPSGGNMLVGNGYDGSSKKLWAQTVSLTPNTNYTFTFYAVALTDYTTLSFGLYGNCTRLGQDIKATATCGWKKYTMTFNSGVLTSLELSIRNISLVTSGNDIGIDDISLVKDNPAINYTTISDDFIWQGYTTDWTKADNWGSCTVPTCSDDVVIPSGLTNYPVLATSATGAVRSMTIQLGATVTLNSGSELQVCGNLLNSGTISASSTATITLMGTTNQAISGSSSTSPYMNLKINKNSGYVIPSNTIYIAKNLNLTKGLITTNAYEIYVLNATSSAVTNFSSASYVDGNLRRAIGSSVNQVSNPSFTSSLTNWTSTGSTSAVYTETSNAYSGSSSTRHLTHYSASNSWNVKTYQTLSGLPNGTYTLSAWVRDANNDNSYMYASGYGGSTLTQTISNNSWTQISITGIAVTNGTCEIGFITSGSANKYIYVDDVSFAQTDAATDYDYPIGDAGKYERLRMSVTSDLSVSSVLGFFTWGTLSGTSGLPLVEGLNVFSFLAQDGYWTLEPDVAPATSARYNITLYLPTYPRGSGPLTFAKRTNASSPWTFNNSSVVGDYSIKTQYGRSGFSTFSQIGIISGTPVSLPVSYLSFNGYATEHKQVELKWITSSEENSHMFNVERSSDGKSYTQIGSVVAAGNSSVPLTYSFLDGSPQTGVNYYRLNQIDRDGSSSYSKVVTVKIGQGNGGYSFMLYPNPSDGQSLYLQTDYSGKALLNLYTIQGVCVKSIQLEVGSGETLLPVSGLSSGAYLMQINTEKQVSHQKLIIK